jgi:hypothetical protein
MSVMKKVSLLFEHHKQFEWAGLLARIFVSLAKRL